MRAPVVFAALGAIDARDVARDSLLRWVGVLAPSMGLLFRFAVPAVTSALQARFDFNLSLYYPLLMSFLPLIAASLIGTVVGFMLLDQRDEQTLAALLVTPVSLGDYLRYRLSVLLMVSVVLSSITLPLAGLTQTTIPQLVLTSLVAAPLAPVYALLLGSFAGNKVQGLALAKAAGVVTVPCVVAYFVTGPWQIAFGIIPHYWALKVFWLFDAGAVTLAFLYAAIGLAWQAMLVALLARRFARIVRR
jgi:fluoroquinolone transport system permease protein